MSKKIETFHADGIEIKVDCSEGNKHFQSYLKTAQDAGFDNMETMRGDSGAFYVARALEYLRMRVFTKQYADNKLLNGGLIPLNMEMPAGTEEDGYQTVDRTGKAKIIENYGDDMPLVDIYGGEIIGKIKGIGAAYEYTVQDFRKDQMAGSSNPAGGQVVRKALAAREAIDEGLEEILGIGNALHNLTGLYNNPLVPNNAVANSGTGPSTLWANKTGAQILADIDTAYTAMWTVSKGKEVPNVLLTDYTSYQRLNSTELDVTFYNKTLMQKIKEKYPNLRIEWTAQIAGVFTGNSNGFILYNNSPEKLEGVIPLRLESHMPERRNLATKVMLDSRCGGVRIFYPKSVSYNYGI